MAAWREHLANPQLRADFGIGFCILFAFIGTFTYVNFILMQPPLEVGMMGIGFIYLVFVPSIVTTPLAGKAVQRFGTQATVWASLAVAGVGLPLLVLPSLSAVLLGMVLVGVGTFFAQAAATGFVSRAATTDRGSASGMYLASLFHGRPRRQRRARTWCSTASAGPRAWRGSGSLCCVAALLVLRLAPAPGSVARH